MHALEIGIETLTASGCEDLSGKVRRGSFKVESFGISPCGEPCDRSLYEFLFVNPFSELMFRNPVVGSGV
jgi:hypothetical protein